MKQQRVLLSAWLLSMLLAGTFSSIQAQDPEIVQGPPQMPTIIPPAPNTASLGQYADVPVGYYSGTPQINIPLHNAEGRFLSVPVSLSYHASGIKVDQVASWVGLGWSLQAGGAISRTMNGMPDETAVKGYWAQYQNAIINPTTTVQRQLAEGEIDLSPDLFQYSFPGQSGKFFIDPVDKKVYTIPYSSLEIIPTISNDKITEFVVYTPDGTKYTFSEKESTHIIHPVEGLHYSGVYTSAWYLEKIETASGDDVIDFEYVTNNDLTTAPVSRSETDFRNPTGQHSQCPIMTPQINYSITASSTKYLSKIITSKETVEFNSTFGNRLDLSGDRILNSIVVKRNGNEFRSFHLSQTYFIASGGSYVSGFFPSSIGDRTKRLRLDEVEERSSSGSSLPAFEFNYDGTKLPPMGSFSVDFWGYFNEQSNTTLLPEIDLGGGDIWDGADRSPSEAGSMASILEKITYPTGGFVEFSFEGHRNALNELVGGVRIAQQRVHDPQNPTKDIIRVYEYASPLTMGITPTTYNTYAFYYVEGNEGIPIEFGPCHYLTRTLGSNAPLTFLQGSHISYTQVVEKQGLNGENGKTTYLYSTGQSDPMNLNPPFPPPTSKDYTRGLPTSTEVASAGGQTMTEQSTSYQFSGSKRTLLGVVAQYRENSINDANDVFHVGYFELISEWVYTDVIHEKKYPSTNSVPSGHLHTTTTLFYDNPRHLFPTRTQVQQSDGSIIETKNKYVADYALTIPLIANLEAKHMDGILIESQQWRLQSGSTNLLLGSSLSNYDDGLAGTQSIFKPWTFAMLESETPISATAFSEPSTTEPDGAVLYTSLYPPNGTSYQYTDRLVLSYTNDGQLESGRPVHGSYTSYLWDTDNILPIAKIENGLVDACAFTSFEENGETGTGNWRLRGSGGGWSLPGVALSGDYSFDLAGTQREILSENSQGPGTYILSFWTLETNGDFELIQTISPGGPSISVPIPSVEVTLLVDGVSSGNWNYYEYKISRPTGSQPVYLGIRGAGSLSNRYIDDIRLFPDGAQMTSFVYDQLLRQTAISDVNGRNMRYEYDDHNRLRIIRDHNGNILQRFSYQYSGQ